MRWFRGFTQTCVYNMWFVLITTWLASNTLSSVKRAQTVHQSYDEYVSRELVLAVGMFIFAIGKKCVIIVWWLIICFNELLFITVNISWAEMLVCTPVFCLKVYGSNRPSPLSPAASLSPSSGEGLHWRPWWVTSRYTNKGGLPGETGLSAYGLGRWRNSDGSRLGSSACVLNEPLQQRQIVFDVWEPDGWKSLHKVLSIMRIPPARSLCVHGC